MKCARCTTAGKSFYNVQDPQKPSEFLQVCKHCRQRMLYEINRQKFQKNHQPVVAVPQSK